MASTKRIALLKPPSEAILGPELAKELSRPETFLDAHRGGASAAAG